MKKVLFLLLLFFILFVSCDKYIFNGKIYSKQFYPAVWKIVPAGFELENKYNWIEDEYQWVNVWHDEYERMVRPDRWVLYLKCGDNIIEKRVSNTEFLNYGVGDYFKVIYYFVPKEVENCVDKL